MTLQHDLDRGSRALHLSTSSSVDLSYNCEDQIRMLGTSTSGT